MSRIPTRANRLQLVVKDACQLRVFVLLAAELGGGAIDILRFATDPANASRGRCRTTQRARAHGLTTKNGAEDGGRHRDAGLHLRLAGLLLFPLDGGFGSSHAVLQPREFRPVPFAHLLEFGMAVLA